MKHPAFYSSLPNSPLFPPVSSQNTSSIDGSLALADIVTHSHTFGYLLRGLSHGVKAFSQISTPSKNESSPTNTTRSIVYLHRTGAGPGSINLTEVANGKGGFAITGHAKEDNSGSQVATAGDVNGDGAADLLVGALWNDGGGINAGRSYVIFGKNDGTEVNLSEIAKEQRGFAITGQNAGDYSGSSLRYAGDVNGDGRADVIIGAPAYTPHKEEGRRDDAGRSYVVFGKANSDEVSLHKIAQGLGGFAIDGYKPYEESGVSVSGAGDVNGDGLDDLIVDAPRNGIAGLYAGCSYVIFGKENGTTVDLKDIADGLGGFAIFGEREGDFSGVSVSTAVDVNGDGFADLVVGAPGNNVTGSSSGRSYVVFGKSDGSAVDLNVIAQGAGGFAINGGEEGEGLGISVRKAGRVNNDNLADLIIDTVRQSGRSYVIFGKRDGKEINVNTLIADKKGLVINGEWSGNLKADGAGDVNGDGWDDVIVGIPDANKEQGVSYVIFGKINSEELTLRDIAKGMGGFAIKGEKAGDLSGMSVGAAGDVDGDGLADVIVGAPGYKQAAGRSYVILSSQIFYDPTTYDPTATVTQTMSPYFDLPDPLKLRTTSPLPTPLSNRTENSENYEKTPNNQNYANLKNLLIITLTGISFFTSLILGRIAHHHFNRNARRRTDIAPEIEMEDVRNREDRGSTENRGNIEDIEAPTNIPYAAVVIPLVEPEPQTPVHPPRYVFDGSDAFIRNNPLSRLAASNEPCR